MPNARYVLLGLAPARSAWFREVAQWANASAIPAEFVKCVSGEEVRARLTSGRAFSAFVVDSSVPSLDRDLVEAAQQAGCAAIVIEDRRGGRDWRALGANAALPAGFGRRELLEMLSAHSVMIGRADRVEASVDEAPAGWQAPLAAVCGPGGTGVSTLAIALAQGLGSDIRTAGSVLLADFALRSEQAMLHDAGDVVPSVQELVERYRTGQPTGDEIRSMAFGVKERHYSLLLGLRQRHAWATIRPRAFTATLEGLRRSYRAVVADVDADLEGEDEGGSIDVEERNTMARTTIAAADAVLVVGSPTMKGLHSLVRVLTEILSFGVPGQRVLTIINRAPRSGRARAQLTSTLPRLLPPWAGAEMPTPLFIPERRVDEALRDGVALPDAFVAPLARAFQAVTARADGDARRPNAPRRVAPGSLGSWGPPDHAEPGMAGETA